MVKPTRAFLFDARAAGGRPSPTGLDGAAVDLAEVDGKLYATDLSNNLYSVNPATGAATLIGPTGIPAVPGIGTPDMPLFDESLYGARGKVVRNFRRFSGLLLSIYGIDCSGALRDRSRDWSRDRRGTNNNQWQRVGGGERHLLPFQGGGGYSSRSSFVGCRGVHS